jgi:DeoR family fructose operon transcriptional repressor
VLADHTKIGVETMCQTIPIERIDVLVTDDRADPEDLDRLREAGVELEIAAVAAPST